MNAAEVARLVGLSERDVLGAWRSSTPPASDEEIERFLSLPLGFRTTDQSAGMRVARKAVAMALRTAGPRFRGRT